MAGTIHYRGEGRIAAAAWSAVAKVDSDPRPGSRELRPAPETALRAQ